MYSDMATEVVAVAVSVALAVVVLVLVIVVDCLTSCIHTMSLICNCTTKLFMTFSILTFSLVR